jgi:hypothetical protein
MKIHLARILTYNIFFHVALQVLIKLFTAVSYDFSYLICPRQYFPA